MGESGSSSSTSIVWKILLCLSVLMVPAGLVLLALRQHLEDPLDLGDKWLGLLGYLLFFGGIVAAVIAVVVMAIVDKPAKPAGSSPTSLVLITLLILSVLMVLAGLVLLAHRQHLVDLGDHEDKWLGPLGGFLLFGGLVTLIVTTAFSGGSAESVSSSPTSLVLITLLILSVLMVLAGSLILTFRYYLLDPLDLGGQCLCLLGGFLLFGGLVTLIVTTAFSGRLGGSGSSTSVVLIMLVILSVLMLLAGFVLLALRQHLVDLLDHLDPLDKWLGPLGGFLLFGGLVAAVITVLIAIVDKPGGSDSPSFSTVAVIITFLILSVLMVLAGLLILRFREHLVDLLDLGDKWLGPLGGFLFLSGIVTLIVTMAFSGGSK
ncbi:uncharacterized protein BdWA1_003905 [Babesia duncani]|uniref:Uncharacterized protein n=1 Tax=Babesia duncani TaxID=323732 RepID=A0AAD9PHG8_9APIC|nr:hypothetical protein BdWA1_003964 [Babesia duncani]KAK2194631.1 hypothetical protein BdWA1_003905 [Babesia duncani]